MRQDLGGALRFTVGETRPGLTIQVAAGGRVVLSRAGEAVMLARIEAHWAGVETWRTGLGVQVAPPWRADEARRLASDSPTGWLRWAHAYAGLLLAGQGPLHEGTWVLRPYDRADLVLSDDPDTYIDWFVGGVPDLVLATRTTEGPDSARVKAWRRAWREGSLPPVLLWWVSCFAGPVLLDGHDRVEAVRAEGGEVPALILERVLDDEMQAESVDSQVDALTHVLAAVDEQEQKGAVGAAEARVSIVRTFARSLARPDLLLSRAEPVPGGVAAWDELAASLTPADWAGR